MRRHYKLQQQEQPNMNSNKANKRTNKKRHSSSQVVSKNENSQFLQKGSSSIATKNNKNVKSNISSEGNSKHSILIVLCTKVQKWICHAGWDFLFFFDLFSLSPLIIYILMQLLICH